MTLQPQEQRRKTTQTVRDLIQDIHIIVWKLALGGHLVGAKNKRVMRALLELQKLVREIAKEVRPAYKPRKMSIFRRVK